MEMLKIEPLIAYNNIDVSEKIIILDTNVILDFLEKRDKDVADFIRKLSVLNKRQLITLGTTIYNISEVLDKELEIKFQLELLKNRNSPDTIIRKVRNRRMYSVEINKLGEDSIRKLFGSINKNLQKALSNFVIFWLQEFTVEDYKILEDLIIRGYLQSQDALMVLTVFKLGAYLLSKDGYLLESPIVNNLVFIYDPSNHEQRRELLKEIGVEI